MSTHPPAPKPGPLGLRRGLPLLLLLSLGLPATGEAQWTVFDPANHLQALYQVKRLIQQHQTMMATLSTLERMETEAGRYRTSAARLQSWLARGSRVFGSATPPIVAATGGDPELAALFRRAFPGETGWEQGGLRRTAARAAELRELAFESIVGVDRHAAQLRTARTELRGLLEEGGRDRTAAEVEGRVLQLQGLEVDELQNLRDLQLAHLKALTTRTVYDRDQARLADSLTTAAILSDSARWSRLLRSDRHWRLINEPENVPLPGGTARGTTAPAGVEGPLRPFRRKPGG